MKTKLTALFIVALSFSFFAKADSNPETKELLSLSFKSSDVVNLTYNAITKSHPQVTILDAGKSIVFAERIENNYGVMRLYNLSSLPEGEYFFEIVDKGTKITKSISYKKQIVNNAQDLKAVVAPTKVAGKYSLTCQGVNNKPVSVSIYNKITGVVFEDYIDSDQDFTRTYDLSKLAKDAYVFTITSEDRVVSKEITLE